MGLPITSILQDINKKKDPKNTNEKPIPNSTTNNKKQEIEVEFNKIPKPRTTRSTLAIPGNQRSFKMQD